MAAQDYCARSAQPAPEAHWVNPSQKGKTGLGNRVAFDMFHIAMSNELDLNVDGLPNNTKYMDDDGLQNSVNS